MRLSHKRQRFSKPTEAIHSTAEIQSDLCARVMESEIFRMRACTQRSSGEHVNDVIFHRCRSLVG